MLDSIDREAGTIRVAGKGNQSASLPPPVEVGEAIADYLHDGRPFYSSRALLLRAPAPNRDQGALQAVAAIVGAATTRAEMDARHSA